MAFDPTPTTYLAGWTEDGTDITLPIASVPELTAAEADATTGDIRKIIYALCEKFYASFNALAAGDKPSQLTINRTTTFNDATNATTRTFMFTFGIASTGTEVKDEPV